MPVAALSSHPRASASFVVRLRSTLIVCVPGLPPNSRLMGSPCRGATSFLFPHFFVFSLSPCVAACPPVLSDPSMFVRAIGLLIVTSSHCSSFEPGIVATMSTLASDLFRPALVSESLRPLRCNSLNVHCGAHSAKLSCKAVSHPVVDPCSPRTSLTSQCVSPLSSSSVPHPHILDSSVLTRSLRLAAVLHSSSGIPCSGAVSAHVASNTLTTIGQESSFFFGSECPIPTRFCAQ